MALPRGLTQYCRNNLLRCPTGGFRPTQSLGFSEQVSHYSSPLTRGERNRAIRDDMDDAWGYRRPQGIFPRWVSGILRALEWIGNRFQKNCGGNTKQ